MADNNTNELDALMISELPTQATANETDLFEVATVDANSASGYASKKESAAAIADAIVGEYQYPLRITGTTAKTIAGAINELKNLVDLLPQFAIEVVQTLPVSDISTTTIYLVPTQDPEQGNYYEEYIYVNNAWELVGTTAVDLSGYYTSAQVDTLLAAKADSASLATVATSGAYSDLSGKPTIDTALDTTSTNAVENRAVASEINSIKSDISVDGSASGDIASFADGSDNPLKELKISIEAVQSGSGDPSPTNVRPISGFNAVNVGDISDTEKVQYFKGLLDGTYRFVDLGSLPWTKTTQYSKVIFYANLTNGSKLSTFGGACSDYPINNDPNYATDKVARLYGSTEWNFSRVAIRDSSYDESDTTAFKTAMNGVYLIYELATPTTPTITPTEFNTLISAFGLQGWLVQIAMPTEAGTVYGGTINPLTGELIVTHNLLHGSDFTWTHQSTHRHYTELFNSDSRYYKQDVTGETVKCNVYKQGNAYEGAVDLTCCLTGRIWILDKNITTEDFNTLMQTTTFLVEYSTPVTYQLTPTEIRSLLGTNNVLADCGAITELKYTRDLNLCINDIIARIEALEGGSSNRSLSLSPVLTKSLTSELDTAEGKAEETEEETKEEAQNER